MDEPLLVIDAADKPGVFQTVRAADGLSLLFALDLQGRPVLAPAKQDEEQPSPVDAAEPDGFLDVAGARQLFPDRCAPLFMQHPAIGFKPGIRDEETLVPRPLTTSRYPARHSF